MLEIGCGTGQATMPLAERGCRIVAVELGMELAAVARRRLERFPSVEVVTSAFEDWPLPVEPFDVVMAATSFKWIDPAVRVRKAADAVRIGGVLATITTRHVAGGSEAFFLEVQGCYERFDPRTPRGLRLPAAADIAQDGAEVERSGRFGPVTFRRYERDVVYSTSQYLDVLGTYSGHRALAPTARAGLFDCIERLIEDRHGGRVTKRYLIDLQVAFRIA